MKCVESYKYSYPLKVDHNGIIDITDLREWLDTRDIKPFVIIDYANSEIGVIQNVKQIIDLVHFYNGIIMLDCTGSIPTIPLDVKELDDALKSLSPSMVERLSQDSKFSMLSADFQTIVQQELLLLVRNKLNMNPKIQNNIQEQLSIIEETKRNIEKEKEASINEMNDYMNEITCEIFSYFDTGKRVSKKVQPERFYHGFVLGLLVDLKGRYLMTSNRESGFGRYDVVIEPKNIEEDAMILEFKVFNSRKETSLEDTVESALAQIEEKNYAADLIARGIPAEHIRKYGFAFRGKEVLIGK